MRKLGFLEETWEEYTRMFYKVIPKNTRERFFNKKVALITIFVVAIEIIIILAYLLLFQDAK